MKNKMSLLIGLVFTGYSAANAQKLETESGNLAFMKDQKSLNLEFNFEGVTIGKSKKPEATFIKEKVEENNSKTAGQGDKWLEDWTAAKTTKFPEKFVTVFQEVRPEINLNPKDGGAKYLCVVKVVNMEPGYKLGMSTIPARVDLELSWFAVEDKSKAICKQKIDNIPGSQALGFDFTSSSRIAESFAKAGKILARGLK